MVVFVVREEERLLAVNGPSERRTEIILDEVCCAGHFIPGSRVERVVAHIFVNRPVIRAGTRLSDDVDLSPSGTTHFGFVTADLHLKLTYRVR